jgi:hypothetical protein
MCCLSTCQLHLAQHAQRRTHVKTHYSSHIDGSRRLVKHQRKRNTGETHDYGFVAYRRLIVLYPRICDIFAGLVIYRSAHTYI